MAEKNGHEEAIKKYIGEIITQETLSGLLLHVSQATEDKADRIKEQGHPQEINAAKWYKAASYIEDLAQLIKDNYRI